MLKKVASLEGYLPAPKNKMMKSVRFLLLAVFVVAATPGSCVIPATCGSLLVTNEGKTSSDTQKEHQAIQQNHECFNTVPLFRTGYGLTR